MQRADTQTISIDAPVTTVIDLITDPAEFPRWAAGFARDVRVDGDDWLVDTGDAEVRLHVRVSHELGTVDYLLADALPGVEIGAFSRVLPNGRGCEFIFTQFLADDIGDADLEDQRAVTAIELQTVRALAERAAPQDVVGARGPQCRGGAGR
jgi:hypothetical protein